MAGQSSVSTGCWVLAGPVRSWERHLGQPVLSSEAGSDGPSEIRRQSQAGKPSPVTHTAWYSFRNEREQLTWHCTGFRCSLILSRPSRTAVRPAFAHIWDSYGKHLLSVYGPLVWPLNIFLSFHYLGCFF